MPQNLKRMQLKFNPFEPSASGPPVGVPPWLPRSWSARLESLLATAASGRGTKALAITGAYGSGKTCVLNWLAQIGLPNHRVRAFTFDNPGVQFYDLANALLRGIGRKQFAKHVWELAAPRVSGYQRSLFAQGFEEFLAGQTRRPGAGAILGDLQEALQAAGVSQDEQICHQLARLVVETQSRPYFEYRDFLSDAKGNLVAEREEAPYFAAILRVLEVGGGMKGVGFLVDEFEEISLQKRLSRREAQDYMATLKRLINLTQHENLWVFLAMTPPAAELSKSLEPALWDRFTSQGKYLFEIPPLTEDEAADLLGKRLEAARANVKTAIDPLFPFPPGVGSVLSPRVLSSPRRLIKVCFFAVANGEAQPLPFSEAYLRDIESQVYPAVLEEEAEG